MLFLFVCSLMLFIRVFIILYLVRYYLLVDIKFKFLFIMFEIVNDIDY